MSDSENRKCAICGTTDEKETFFPAELLRPSLAHFIKKEHPEWNANSWICQNDLTRYRNLFLNQMINMEKGETKTLEKDVKKRLKEYELVSENVNDTFESKLKFGERLADKIASFGGSWKFIIIFGTVLFLWIGINSWFLLKKPYDPYPYILLNLILSCLAAIQAPIIMMSQNRHAAREKLKADYEYKINLKAELEIRHINEKIDFLLMKQWQRLLEIQQFQVELMEEITKSKK